MKKWSCMVLIACCMSLALPAMAAAGDERCSQLTGSFRQTCTVTALTGECKVICTFFVMGSRQVLNNYVQFLDNGMCKIGPIGNTSTMECAIPLKNDFGRLKPEG